MSRGKQGTAERKDSDLGGWQTSHHTLQVGQQLPAAIPEGPASFAASSSRRISAMTSFPRLESSLQLDFSASCPLSTVSETETFCERQLLQFRELEFCQVVSGSNTVHTAGAFSRGKRCSCCFNASVITQSYNS